MEKAKLLIKDIPLNQLALEVGYSDIFAFSKAYKKYYGLSPSETIAQHPQ